MNSRVMQFINYQVKEKFPVKIMARYPNVCQKFIKLGFLHFYLQFIKNNYYNLDLIN